MRHGDAPPLTRERIVAAGLRLLEREGAAGLGMRGLAGELGKAPAAVYRHIGGKGELMSLLFDEVARRIVLPDPGADPRTAVVEAAQSAHLVLEEHGWIAAGLLDGTLRGVAWTRFSECVLAALVRGGMSDERAARPDIALRDYLVGHLVAARAGAQDRAPARPVSGGAGAADCPTVRRVAPLVASMSDRERFAAGLYVLLDGAFAEPREAHGGEDADVEDADGAPSVSRSAAGAADRARAGAGRAVPPPGRERRPARSTGPARAAR